MVANKPEGSPSTHRIPEQVRGFDSKIIEDRRNLIGAPAQYIGMFVIRLATFAVAACIYENKLPSQSTESIGVAGAPPEFSRVE
jgi:hypothetical protein